MSNHQYNTKSLKTETWFIIVNPAAAGGRGKSIWPAIKKELIYHKIDFTFRFSDYERHTILLANNAVSEGYRKLLGVGGDGTLNEMVNGIFQNENIREYKDVTVAIIPAGTGNDWIKSHRISNHYKEVIKNLHTYRTLLQDIGKINMKTEKGESTHYYLNIAGVGFNASVVKNTRLISQKAFQTKYNYLLALIMSLIGFKAMDLSISTEDSGRFELPVFAMSVAICQFNGGGMLMVPHARYDDGLLSLTVIEKISKLKVIRNFFKLFDGSFVNNKEIKTLDARKVTISGGHAFGVEMDGELIGETKMVTFENLPAKLRVLSNNT